MEARIHGKEEKVVDSPSMEEQEGVKEGLKEMVSKVPRHRGTDFVQSVGC